MFWTTGPVGQSLPLECHCLDQIKGWTRSSVVMTILVAASELDLSDEKATEQLRPLFGVLDKCWMVPVQVTSLQWFRAVNGFTALFSVSYVFQSHLLDMALS